MLGILFVAISNLFGILPAQLIRHALDVVASNIDTYRLFSGSAMQNDFYDLITFNIFLFGAMVLLMALLKGIFMFMMRQTIIVMSRHIEYDLKNEIYEQYQKLSMSFYSINNTGDLMNRISEDVSRVRMYIGPAIMYTINLTVMFLLVITAMFSVNSKLAIYVLTPLPFMVFLIYYVHDIINKKSERVQEKLSGLSTFVQETFSGIRVLKSFVREKSFQNNFSKQSEEYRQLSMDLVRVNALFYPIMLTLVGVSSILTVYIGGLEAIAGTVTIGNIAEFTIYVYMLTWPVASLGWVVTLVQRAAASQERINEFLHEKPDIVSGKKQLAVKGKIEFRNVSFTYPNTGIKALQDISFKVEAGKSLAILGRTGSGKTTVANLLLRLFDPGEGSVLIDDADLRELDLDSFRKNAGYVPQDVFLFSDTISNNISFGLSGLKVDSNFSALIEQAAKDSAIYNNIIEFEKQFETMVGERGIILSGGQKQRISIARALIRKPRILILDDCLSAVDTKTEEEILSSLKTIMKGRTTIIIGHRVSSVKNADRILVLDHGKIAEEGTHAGLLQKNGLYASIYERQQLEEVENK